MKRNSTPSTPAPAVRKASAASKTTTAASAAAVPFPAPSEGSDVQVSAVLARIQALWSSLGPVGQRIADFIVKNPREVVHMSVSEVAERTGSSEGSIVGLCKNLGATGFQQIKIALAQELVRPVQFIHEDLDPQDNATAVIRKIFNSNVQTLHDTEATLDAKAMERAVSCSARPSASRSTASAARPPLPRTRTTACCASA
jgi:RpiR family carbohydrate utilization transcriptional regulator